MAETAYKKIGQYYFNPAAPIGKGAFGTVYLGFDTTNKDSRLAVKAINIGDLLDDDIERELVLREIQVLRQIKGEHIVSFVDALRTTNNLYIFMEYCDGGDLDSKIKNGQDFSEDEACSIIKQIAKAFVDVDKLEINNSGGNKISIMHRDIKPANILFHKGKIKLADFGFAKVIDDVDKDIRKLHTTVGSPLYSPPQILGVKKFSAKCDVWSAGIVFYLLIFKKTPWTARSEHELLLNITTKELQFPDTVSIRSDTRDLITRMLKVEESDRLSWNEVYEHPALKNCEA